MSASLCLGRLPCRALTFAFAAAGGTRGQGQGPEATSVPTTPLRVAHLALNQVPPVQCFLCSLLVDRGLGSQQGAPTSPCSPWAPCPHSPCCRHCPGAGQPQYRTAAAAPAVLRTLGETQGCCPLACSQRSPCPLDTGPCAPWPLPLRMPAPPCSSCALCHWLRCTMSWYCWATSAGTGRRACLRARIWGAESRVNSSWGPETPRPCAEPKGWDPPSAPAAPGRRPAH